MRTELLSVDAFSASDSNEGSIMLALCVIVIVIVWLTGCTCAGPLSD